MDEEVLKVVDGLGDSIEPLEFDDRYYSYEVTSEANVLYIHVRSRNHMIRKARPIEISVPEGIEYWISLTSCFCYNTRLSDITALSSLDASRVRSMRGMFRRCYNLTDLSPLSNWDVSNVDDLTGMFYGCKRLRDLSPLSQWKPTIDVQRFQGFYCVYCRWAVAGNAPIVYTAQFTANVPAWLMELHERYEPARLDTLRRTRAG